MARLSSEVEIGYVARAHGVRGELRVVTHNPASGALGRATRVWLGSEPRTVVSARPIDGAWLLVVDGIADKTAADARKGRKLLVERAVLELEPDEHLLMDLVGCKVFLRDGRPWGQVVALETGPQDRLVIRDGSVERLFPVVDALLIEVDVEAGRLVVDPPDGWPEEVVE